MRRNFYEFTFDVSASELPEGYLPVGNLRRPARPGRYRMPGRMIKSSGYGQKGASVAAPRIRNDNLEYVEECKNHPHGSRAS
jgi:hypothetical protein